MLVSLKSRLSLSPCLMIPIKFINTFFVFALCQILTPLVNQNENMTTNTINKFQTHLLSIRAERQEMIHPNSHSTYNERQQKIIELIDWS